MESGHNTPDRNYSVIFEIGNRGERLDFFLWKKIKHNLYCERKDEERKVMRKAGRYYKWRRMHPYLQGVTNRVRGGHQMRNLTMKGMRKQRKNRTSQNELRVPHSL